MTKSRCCEQPVLQLTPGSSYPSNYVDSSTFEEGSQALPRHQDLCTGQAGLILPSGLAGRHHHPPLDGVEGVGRDARDDGHHPAQQEGVDPVGVLSEDCKEFPVNYILHDQVTLLQALCTPTYP